MKLSAIIKSKKLKNFCATLLEIIIVAAIIMGILTTIQSKLKSGSGTNNAKTEEEMKAEETVKEDVGDEYYLELNIKQAAIIVYQYNKDKSEKKPIKVMSASVGKQVAEDKYKLRDTYLWMSDDNDKSWNKYNVKYTDKGWIQSADYSEKYSWTLNKDSYKAIGTKQSDDKCIKLYAKDANWIYTNCGSGTVFKIVKGTKKDELPIEIEKSASTFKKCGWDPTDPEEGNPYLTYKKGVLVGYDKTVYVEKGTTIDYLANVLLINTKGEDITKQLKYDEIDSSTLGAHNVKYTFKLNNGGKLKAIVKYEIIDTLVPVVKIAKNRFIYEVESKSPKHLNKASVKTAIEDLVKKSSSASEGTIKVYALPKEDLIIGDNHVRVVATDSAGNVGSQECVVEIKVKEKTTTKKEETTKKNDKEKDKKKDKDKKKEKDKNKDKDKDKDKEKDKDKSEEETKKEEETTSAIEEETTQVQESNSQE